MIEWYLMTHWMNMIKSNFINKLISEWLIKERIKWINSNKFANKNNNNWIIKKIKGMIEL